MSRRRNFDFRLTSVVQKRLCLSSLLSKPNPLRDEALAYTRYLTNTYFAQKPSDVGYLCTYQCYARGGGPRDEVGTLKVRASPTWGILANFEHTCWPQGREV